MPPASSSSTPPSLEIMDLLPVGFVKRSDVPTELSVTPLPADLERDIDSPLDSDRSPWTRDLQALFSYEHLGYLYARFLGPKGLQRILPWTTPFGRTLLICLWKEE